MLSDSVSYSLSLSRLTIEADSLPTYSQDAALTVRIGNKIVFEGIVVFSSTSSLVLRSFYDYLTQYDRARINHRD
jgi:hypothetical protein